MIVQYHSKPDSHLIKMHDIVYDYAHKVIRLVTKVDGVTVSSAILLVNLSCVGIM